MLSTILNGFRNGQMDWVSILSQILATVFVILLILPLHEYAHGWVAKKLGDPTAQYAGRLTFNPIASVEPMGALMLFLVGIGWAKPVPVNPAYFKNPKRGMALTALAGPVSNFLAALAGGLLFNVVAVLSGGMITNTAMEFVYRFLSSYVLINISIGVFNLLPVPPLDGFNILSAFLPDRLLHTVYRYQNVITIGLFLLLLVGFFSGPLSVLQTWFVRGIMAIADLPFKLCGLL